VLDEMLLISLGLFCRQALV